MTRLDLTIPWICAAFILSLSAVLYALFERLM